MKLITKYSDLAKKLNISLSEIKDFRISEIKSLIEIALLRRKYYTVIREIFLKKPKLEQSFSPPALQDSGDFYSRLNQQSFQYGVLSCLPLPPYEKYKEEIYDIYLLLRLPDNFWKYSLISQKANNNYTIIEMDDSLIRNKDDSVFIFEGNNQECLAIGKGELEIYNKWNNFDEEKFIINKKITLERLLDSLKNCDVY